MPIVEPAGGSGSSVALPVSIANGGTGATTGSAAAGALDREQNRLTAFGCKGWCWDPGGCITGGQSITSQRVFAQLVGMLNGDVVTNVVVSVVVAGAGTTPTGIYVALYATSGTQLAVSNNLNSNAIWTTASNAFVQAPLSSPYTITSTNGYYIALLVNGTWGTTQLTMLGNGNSNNAAGAAGPAGPFLAPIQSSQATMPSPATFVTGGSIDNWLGWS